MRSDLRNLLVSVIVPFFNEEKHLPECAASILDQTHDNVEVILVDDGSADNSRTIAKSIEAKDSRVNVITQNNKGVSAARNVALGKATGDYVVFVDSDDYLSPDFVHYMLAIVKETQSEFCMSTNIFTCRDMAQVKNDTIDVCSPEDATCSLLYPGITIGCWNKIYEREFLVRNKIIFPENLFMGEGLNFITQVAQLATRVGVGHRKVYFYRTDNCDSATSKFDIKKIVNAFESIENIRKNLTICSPKVLMALDFHLWSTHVYALQGMMSASAQDAHDKFFRKYISYLKENALSIIKADVSFFTKLQIFCIRISPKFTVGLVVFFKKYTNR